MFSPPLAGGDEGEGEIIFGKMISYHPPPSPSPVKGEGSLTFYEVAIIAGPVAIDPQKDRFTAH